MCLSKNIRYLRKKKNYSQDEIAEILGYKSYTTIQKWEMGVSEPPIAKLKKMAEIFSVDINELTTKKLYEEDCDIISEVNKEEQDFKALMSEKNGLYFRLAKEAKNLELDEDDVNTILKLYSKHRDKNM